MMQDRGPSKVQVDKLLYTRLSLMNLVGFAYTSLYHSGSSEIKMEKKSPYLRDFKEHNFKHSIQGQGYWRQVTKIDFFSPQRSQKTCKVGEMYTNYPWRLLSEHNTIHQPTPMHPNHQASYPRSIFIGRPPYNHNLMLCKISELNYLLYP